MNEGVPIQRDTLVYYYGDRNHSPIVIVITP